MHFFREARGSFGLKLGVSFVLVILVALSMVYFLVNTTAHREFQSYVIKGTTRRAGVMKDQLIDYYRRNGTWQGLGDFLKNVSGEGRGFGRGGGNYRMTLTDPKGNVLFSSGGVTSEAKLPKSIVEDGIRLRVDGNPVGVMLAGPVKTSGFEQAEQSFLQSVNQALIYGGLIGLGAAAVLGFLLIRYFTRPLDRLTKATERISSGDLDQKVKVKSGGQLEKLGKAFNQMTESLQRSERLRRSMIADIAHELRTPITVIKGGLESLEEGIYEPTEERISEIEEDVELLERLVEDLHDLSLADAGELPLQKSSVDYSSLIYRIEKSLRPELSKKDIDLETVVPEDLPSVQIDSARVEQVLVNLIENSARFTPPDGEIKVEVDSHGDQLLTHVIDTGQGIPPDRVDRVFDRFYRGDSSRSRSGGSGLGLSIAKELVEAHGGWISAESEGRDRGAKLTFSLPISSRS